MNPVRKKRIEKELKKLINSTLEFKIRDKRLSFVSVTSISITDDLAYANIYYSTLPNTDIKKVEEAFLKAAGFIKNEIAKAKILRTIPELRFFYDDTQDRAEKIEKILEKIKNED